MPDPTPPDAPPPVAPLPPQTHHKAWAAAVSSALLSAIVVAVMATTEGAKNEIAILWQWQWCDIGVDCPAIKEKYAVKAIIETFLGQGWRALSASIVTGPIIGGIVGKVQNKAKDL